MPKKELVDLAKELKRRFGEDRVLLGADTVWIHGDPIFPRKVKR